jgi:hypothetical protein
MKSMTLSQGGITPMKRKAFGWTLPPEIERRLSDTSYGRQRAIFEADHLLLVLHAPPRPDDSSRETRVFLRTPDGGYQCNGGPEGDTKLWRVVKEYRERCDELEQAYRKSQRAEELFEIIESAAPLHHSASNLRDTLQAAREHVPEDRLLIAVRDDSYEVARNLGLLLADARCALDYRIAHHAEQQATEMRQLAMAQHKLNVLAAITFPLLIVATLFGMNVPHGLENSPPMFFYAVFGVGLLIGLCVKTWVTANGNRRG